MKLINKEKALDQFQSIIVAVLIIVVLIALALILSSKMRDITASTEGVSDTHRFFSNTTGDYVCDGSTSYNSTYSCIGGTTRLLSGLPATEATNDLLSVIGGLPDWIEIVVVVVIAVGIIALVLVLRGRQQ